MTPEGKVKVKVKALLRDHNAYYFMPVQAGYGAPGLDFFCCVHGFFLAIETKAGKAQPTARQGVTMAEIERAGGYTMVIREDNIGELEIVLDMMEKCEGRLDQLAKHARSNS